jgi:ribonuclease HI
MSKILSNSKENHDGSNLELGSTLYIACFVNWRTTAQGVKCGPCTCGYSIYKNKGGNEKSPLRRDYFPGGIVESAYEAEMKALLEGIMHIPHEERLTIRTTQQSISNGINRDLAFWSEHNWHTRQGTPVKCQQEWWEFLTLAQGRKIVALCTQEEEFALLQSACRDLLQFLS